MALSAVDRHFHYFSSPTDIPRDNSELILNRCCSNLLLAGWLGLVCQFAHCQDRLLPVPGNSGKPLVASENDSPKASIANISAVDADLNDLAIISDDRLCAVGNCGVIMVSSDAGRRWSQVPSPTSVNLRAVAFLDEDIGLAIGGEIGSHTRTSRAVILKTEDGGRSWKSIPNNLPALRGMQITKGLVVAWGYYSPEELSGLFISHDLGSSWRPQATGVSHVHTATVAGDQLIVIDFAGQAYLGRLGSDRWQATELGPGRENIGFVTATKFGLFAGGEQGTFKTSRDGRVWDNCVLPLSEEARGLCQWEALAESGEELWVCGSPGSVLLHSRDGGQSWSLVNTEQSLPIRQIRFRDTLRGWAVGPLGRILATRDGGQSWYHQRADGVRLGILSMATGRSSIRWEPLISAAWSGKLNTACLTVRSRENMRQQSFIVPEDELLLDIQPQLGLAGADYSLPKDAGASELAFQCRVWQPDAVLASGQLGESLGRGTVAWADESLGAIQLAASTSASVLDELYLAPWQVGKLVTDAGEQNAEYSENSQRLLRELGLAVGDILQPLPPAERSASQATLLRTLWSSTSNRSAQSALLGGIPPSEQTSRHIVTRELGNYQLVMGRVHRQNSLSKLAEQDCLDSEWQDQFRFLMQSLPEHEAESALVGLAELLWNSQTIKRLDLVLHHIVQRNPKSDAARWAMLQRLQILGSEELLAWQSCAGDDNQRPLPIAQAPKSTPNLANEPWNASPFNGGGEDSEVPQTDQGSVRFAAAEIPIETPLTVDSNKWFQALGSYSQWAPDLVSRPDIMLKSERLATQSAVKYSRGDNWSRLSKSVDLAGWSQAVKNELHLKSGALRPEQSVAFAIPAEERPYLDGVLNEALWQAAPALNLWAGQETPGKQGVTNRTTQFKWAYDSEYLYLAVVSPREVVKQSQVQRLRTYDADLSRVDHVAFLIDTDRDYTTSVEMAVAKDGRTYDRICGHTGFDPKWHVSVGSTEDAWTAEMAIEHKYFTTTKELAGNAWGIAALRSKPGEADEFWGSESAEALRPEFSGLLLFLPPE